MRCLKSAILFTAATLGALSSALAGTLDAFEFSNAPNATAPVARLSNPVTYAKPGETLKTYIGFNVGSGSYLLKNTSGNTINSITITFTASVTDLNEKLKLVDTATYLAALPGCTYPAIANNPLVITCAVRQLKTGDSFPSFTVFYEAPAKVLGGLGDAIDSDKVKLDIKVVYAERDNGGNPLPNSVIEKLMADGDAVTLGTDNPLDVRSAVPKGGGTLFTGVGAVATPADPWTTTVMVPANFTAATGTYTTAEIFEATFINGDTTCTLASNLYDCSATQLTIPGSFSHLTIYLRRDASTLVFPNKPNEINSAKIFYSSPTHPAVGVTYPLDIPACTDTTYGPLPQVGIPCINKRTRYTNSNSPTSEWLKDWEFVIFALDNGRYSQ